MDHAHSADQHPHGHAHGTAEPGPLADASVRRARTSDAPAVGFVQAVVWREAYAEVVDPDVAAAFEPQSFASAWRQSLTAPPGPEHALLVACAGDQVVGFAALGPSEDPDAQEGTVEIHVLAVHPDARRQGHGSRLLAAVADTARGRGRSEVQAWVLASDDATRAFLTAAGLATDGAHRSRVIAADGRTASEVRLSAALGE
jgi:ribosomal protein S18 acetylase RimI-like enzyme